jgi:hypothetical protein
MSDICSFVVYLMLSVIQDRTIFNDWIIVNNELEGIWEEEVPFLRH